MNKVFTIALIFCVTSIGISQNFPNEKDSILTEFKPIFLPYISLSSPFETYNSIDIGLLKSIRKNNDIGVELGYIYNLQSLNERVERNWYNNVYGLKAYFYYRFFLNLKKNYPSNSRTFIDIEPQFYWASFEAERVGGFACNEAWGDCEYYKFYDSRVDRIVPGLNIKMGKIYELDPIYITIFAGLSYRYVIEYSEMNNETVMPDKIFNKNGIMSDLQTGGILKLRLGLQLAYNFWK